MQMSEINVTIKDFPVVFKICITPGFDAKNLKFVGYSSVYNYFAGESRHNSSLIGWAGHTQEGTVLTDVAGALL